MGSRLRNFDIDFDEAEVVLLAQMYLDQQEQEMESSEPSQGRTAPRHRKSKSESFANLDKLSLPLNDVKRSSLPAPPPPPLPLPPWQYQYKPLRSKDDIRLISISISEVDDKLYFQLTRQDRSDCPAYEAVSYTWGSTERTRKIYHAFSGQALAITENCEAVLRALHKKGKLRRLWLDAISINQDDIEERSHQVSIMDDVFRNALRTIIYLGPPDTHTSALSRWPEIQRLTKGFDEKIYEKSCQRAFYHVEALLTRPWFTRTWVIQEVLLSKELTMQAGETELSLPHIAELLQRYGDTRSHLDGLGIMDIHSKYGTEPNTKTRNAHRLGWLGKRSTSWRSSALGSAVPSKGYLKYWQLFNLLLETAAYNCRDPRDKLYALISLFDGDTPSELLPDYSLSVEKVYTNITRYLICAENMTISLSAACSVGNSSKLPSWVIDWRSAPTVDGLLHGKLGDRTRYNAGTNKHLQHVPILPSTGKTLRLRGIRVASIHLKLYHRNTINGSRSPLLEDDDPREVEELIWFTRKGFHLEPATFAWYLPAKTWPLDIVCVFLGFEVPFVLREHGDGWQVIGECDVEEIMYGQALEGVDWSQVDAPKAVWPLEDFDLV